jgi:hypothetical protein
MGGAPQLLCEVGWVLGGWVSTASRWIGLKCANNRASRSVGDGLISVGGVWEAACEMNRHTTFKFCLDPTADQHDLFMRHAGAAQFAFNQSLRTVKTALSQRRSDPALNVPWTGFDLIKSFNAWKKSGDAGRKIVVDSVGIAEVEVTGLGWRGEVCQQVFEEAAVERWRRGQSRAAVNV